MKNKQDHFNVLRGIQKNPESSQRELAEELGFSLGKLNYCIKALQKTEYQAYGVVKTHAKIRILKVVAMHRTRRTAFGAEHTTI